MLRTASRAGRRSCDRGNGAAALASGAPSLSVAVRHDACRPGRGSRASAGNAETHADHARLVRAHGCGSSRDAGKNTDSPQNETLVLCGMEADPAGPERFTESGGDPRDTSPPAAGRGAWRNVTPVDGRRLTYAPPSSESLLARQPRHLSSVWTSGAPATELRCADRAGSRLPRHPHLHSHVSHEILATVEADAARNSEVRHEQAGIRRNAVRQPGNDLRLALKRGRPLNVA